MVQDATASKLARALRSGQPALVAEWVPAAASDTDSLKRFAAALPPSLDAVVVAGNGVSALAYSILLAADGIEPVLTLSTSDRNREALLSDARGATLLGIKNALCLPGSDRSGETAASFDVDPTQLVQLLKSSDGPVSALLVGAEVYPQVRPLQLALIDARKKVAAGAGFLITQPVFDMAAFEEWMAAVREEGIAGHVPILAAAHALTSADEAIASQRRRRIPDEVIARLQGAADAAAEGFALCAELAARLMSVEGVRGLYIRSTGRAEEVAEIIRRAGLRSA